MKFKIYVTTEFQDEFVSSIKSRSEDGSFCSEKAAQKTLDRAIKRARDNSWPLLLGIIYSIKKTERSDEV
jgi:hypothetical protein